MSNLYKEKKQDSDDNDFDVGFKIPDTKNLLERLKAESLSILKQEHKEEMEEEKKQGKPKKSRQGGTICCCGESHCSIGPMVSKE